MGSRTEAPEATPGWKEPGRLSPGAWGWLAALVGWTLLFSVYDLDGGAGLEPTDAWVAQTAREMRATGDWIVPRFSGDLRLQKSPGPYWAVVLTSLARGEPVNEVCARMPNALAAVLLVVTVFWLGRHIAGERAAVFAGWAAAGSVLVLYWSHRAASDFGVTTLMALSLACLWIGSECARTQRGRVLLWLAGYLAAGLAMLYKMPVPLVCVGLPALGYLLLCRRWRILASGWHLLGLLLFLLPWLPWVLAVLQHEPTAWDKWRIEFWDRLTGRLAETHGEAPDPRLYLLYIGVVLLLVFPFTLSVPAAIARAFPRKPGVHPRGRWFLLIWFGSLFVFFTLAPDKQARYILPALPPLLVLLGMELARLFDPSRPATPRRDRAFALGLTVLLPSAVAVALAWGWRFLARHPEAGLPPWGVLGWRVAVGVAPFLIGAIVGAWLYARRREGFALASLLAGMGLTWVWAWSQVFPLVVSQAPFKDFAQQLRELTPEQQKCLRQVAQPDPRIVWYSGVALPRLVDPMELLAVQDGRRDVDFEMRYWGERMIEALESERLVLLVASPATYVRFRVHAARELARLGRTMPPIYVWRQARVGRLDRRFVLFGNQPPPPGTEPDTSGLDAWIAKARRKLENRSDSRPSELRPTTHPDGG